MASSFSNLAITVVGGATAHTIGHLIDKLQSIIGNGGRDNNCKFYYDRDNGGSLVQVLAGVAMGALKDEAVNAFNSWLGGKKNGGEKTQGKAWVEAEDKEKEDETLKYGAISIIEGGQKILALDDWGHRCYDALMLAIETENDIRYDQEYYNNSGGGSHPLFASKVKSKNETKPVKNPVSTKTLVWYDVTALININSDKNIVITRVQGRDYSRKELVSNGDIKFSVSGQITSKYPDVYPTNEVKKFLNIMKYKGIVRVNNQLLDQFGIENIIITDFSLSAREGYKSVQQYSFSAIGLQPKTEEISVEDTIQTVSNEYTTIEKKKDDNKWQDMLNNTLSGLKSAASDIFSQGAALATGMVEKSL